MTEVDFYIIDAMGDEPIARTACRITHKAWSQGLRVYVLSRSESEAARVDDLLWTFAQDSFIAHERWHDGESADPLRTAAQPTSQSVAKSPPSTLARVLIGTSAQPPSVPELLVNLGADSPSWSTQCARVADIVGADPEHKAEGRRRYRAYREQGVSPRTHEV